ncbi:hypothetical protein cypCar_00043479 [Cyprinus carpio]|nr:hypothetical protein cypCar_00043479 [Cyprinus carpio]
MTNFFIVVPVCVFSLGVFVDYIRGVSVSVMEGDSVTLNTDVKTNQHDIIKWYFNNIRIAQISEDLSFICTDVQCNEGTERFRDRLKLDHQTGSLTIMNITNTDSGDYKLKIINSSSISEKTLQMYCLLVNGVNDLSPDQSDVPLMDVAHERSSDHTDAPVKNTTNDSSSNHTDALVKNTTNDSSSNHTDALVKNTTNDSSSNHTDALVMNTTNDSSSNHTDALVKNNHSNDLVL